MIDEEGKKEISSDPQGNSDKPQDPSQSQDGDSKQDTETDDLPERFQGKTVKEVAKDYIELQKSLGKQSGEVNKTRKQLEQWEALGRVIKNNPELEKAISGEIEKLSGKAPSQSNGEQPKRDDTRLALENQIVTRFEEKYGIHRIDGEKKKDLHGRIGQELKDMFDPTGTKSVREILDTIPLDRLDKYLDKAYRLATVDDSDERSRAEGVLQARQNNEATFGSIPGTGVNSKQQSLSEQERKVAARMGISEEKYLKNKQEMEKEQ